MFLNRYKIFIYINRGSLHIFFNEAFPKLYCNAFNVSYNRSHWCDWTFENTEIRSETLCRAFLFLHISPKLIEQIEKIQKKKKNPQ